MKRVILVLFIFTAALCVTAGATDDLESKVVIRRDTYGVPHILAETEEAAAFGYGYASAEDRVLLMARLYLRARSEEAKYFGERFATDDLTTLRFRNYAVAEKGFAESPPWFQRYLDGFAAGYNRYLEHRRTELPDWVKPISGIDVLAHGRRVVVMEFCMNLRQIGQIERMVKQEAARVEPESMIGSNMWAFNKERSESGNALLLGNPHLNWAEEHIWHEMHVTVPGEINFMGASLVGFPGAGLGFNDKLGWSHTVNPHDCDDIYELTLDPKDENRYLYEGESVAMTKETISVEVKTDDGVETRTKDVYWTHYGPVVKRIGDKAYAFKSPHINESRMLQQWYMMAKAQNLEEFRRILDMQALPMFNIAYADVEGNCFFICNGRFPDRPEGYNWAGIVPGGTQETEWSWIIPEGDLPSLLNPKGGYVQNSNSAPWYTNLNAVLDRTLYAPGVFPNSNSLRTQHGQLLIEANESVTLEEIMRDKYSMRLLAADRVKGDLVAIARDRKADGVDLNEAVEVLESWDNTVSRDSEGAVLFVEFVNAYQGKANPVYQVDWDEHHPASTPHGIGDPEAALNALARAVRTVTKKHGALRVPWGDVHRLRKGDVDIPIGGTVGDYGAFRVIGYRADKDGKEVAAGGDSYVFAVEFSEPLKAYSVLAYSQSDDPESPHYTDQCALFANEKFKPAWFSEADIKANTERAYRVGKGAIEPVTTGR